jgi:hypothetical protein
LISVAEEDFLKGTVAKAAARSFTASEVSNPEGQPEISIRDTLKMASGAT